MMAQMPSPASLDVPAEASPALMEADPILFQLETRFSGLESSACSLDFKV